MKILEIIRLRMTDGSIEEIMQHVCSDLKDDPSVTVYRQIDLETDIALHLHYDSEEKEFPSQLGQHLAETLSAYGFIERRYWSVM